MKMKVGDIEMDSESGISFDSDEAEGQEEALQRREVSREVDAPGSTNASDVAESSLIEWVDEHRGLVKIVGGGSAVLAVGTLAMMFVAGSWFFSLPAFMWALWSAGAAYLIWHVDRSMAENKEAHRASLLDDARDIRRALIEDAGDRKVDEIKRELDWSEARTVRALAAGVEEGILREDLDTSTEHWVYSAASTGELDGESMPKEAIPATERAKQLEKSPMEDTR
jgi:predicted DNA-binding transcriptional regulator